MNRKFKAGSTWVHAKQSMDHSSLSKIGAEPSRLVNQQIDYHGFVTVFAFRKIREPKVERAEFIGTWLNSSAVSGC
jgi:hypothetical protein